MLQGGQYARNSEKPHSWWLSAVSFLYSRLGTTLLCWNRDKVSIQRKFSSENSSENCFWSFIYAAKEGFFGNIYWDLRGGFKILPGWFLMWLRPLVRCWEGLSCPAFEEDFNACVYQLELDDHPTLGYYLE